MHILLIEDEKKVASFIEKGLEGQSYIVTLARDGDEGEKLALDPDAEYDVIVIDAMLPKKNGFALCQAIRKKRPTVPIMMLTALDTTDDKVRGFDAGADDYLTKPFEFREFIARLRALANRGKNVQRGNSLEYADVIMNLDAKSVTRSGTKIALSAKEFALLEFFLRNKDKVVTRQSIASSVWGLSFDTESNVIDVYVNFLRKKIDKDFSPKLIHTVVGMGYVLRVEEE
ncbi:MAG: response regulator transcription factor [Candidatus Kapabacteria bacterium]|nr:response regulator transcription factor [Candidatus Kapabacteria bacterium]